MRPLFSWRSRASRRVASYLPIKHGLSEDEREQCPITVRRGCGVDVPRNPAVDVFGLDLVGQANLEIRKDSFQARFDVALAPVVHFAVAPDVLGQLPETDRRPPHVLRQFRASPNLAFPFLIKRQGVRLSHHFFPVEGTVLSVANPPNSRIPEPSPRHPLPLLMTCAPWGNAS